MCKKKCRLFVLKNAFINVWNCVDQFLCRWIVLKPIILVSEYDYLISNHKS